MASPEKRMDRWIVEYTDTFGGEANYARVHRETIEVPRNASQRTIVRRAKSAIGLTGVRGRIYGYGDDIEFRPYGSPTIMFVTFDDCSDD